MTFYRGTGGTTQGTRAGEPLLSQNNLSDVASTTTAKQNLGITDSSGNLTTSTEKGVVFPTPDTAPFSLHTHRTLFNGTWDNCLGWCYNITPGTGGTKVVSTEPMLFLQMEANYNTGSAHFMEMNLDYVSEDGLTYKRHLAWYIDRATHTGAWGWGGKSFAFYKDTIGANPYFNIDLTNATDSVFTMRIAGASNEVFQFGPQIAGSNITLFDSGFGALSATGGRLSTSATEAILYVGTKQILRAGASTVTIAKNDIGVSAPNIKFDLTNAVDAEIIQRFAGGSGSLFQFGPNNVGSVLTSFAVGWGATSSSGGHLITTATNADLNVGGTAIIACTAALATVAGDVAISTSGKGLKVKEGSNAKQGTSTLVAGSSVVSNTSVTANSRIFLTSQVDGGTPGWLRVSTRTAGTSFTITSSSGTDTSTVAYQIFEPA